MLHLSVYLSARLFFEILTGKCLFFIYLSVIQCKISSCWVELPVWIWWCGFSPFNLIKRHSFPEGAFCFFPHKIMSLLWENPNTSALSVRLSVFCLCSCLEMTGGQTWTFFIWWTLRSRTLQSQTSVASKKSSYNRVSQSAFLENGSWGELELVVLVSFLPLGDTPLTERTCRLP